MSLPALKPPKDEVRTVHASGDAYEPMSQPSLPVKNARVVDSLVSLEIDAWRKNTTENHFSSKEKANHRISERINIEEQVNYIFHQYKPILSLILPSIDETNC